MKGRPTYENQKLTLPTGEVIPVGEDDWFQWLRENKSFTVEVPNSGIIRYTARKDATKGGIEYWYGYKRINGALRKKFIGKTEELTWSRLEGTASDLRVQTPIGHKEDDRFVPEPKKNDDFSELEQMRRAAFQREKDFDRLLQKNIQLQRRAEELEQLHGQSCNSRTLLSAGELLNELRKKLPRTKVSWKDIVVLLDILKEG